ncbi:MAG: hypothetical protein K0V04_24425, partial [Deltaproteobacteria bacterium]|nr:hypothetical protein [Deltaproteobacteria bacterium]
MTLVSILPAACGKEQPPTSAPAPDTPALEEPKTWSTMSRDDKKQHMMDEVTPKMASLFQGVAPEHYAEFNCMTCHGPGAKEGDFSMPSASLPKLPPNGDFAQLMETKP